MRAIQVHQFGGADQLAYDDVSIPEPGPGELRVKVQAIGLNFVEIYQRKGLYPGKLPFIPGAEFSGTVDAVGQGVMGFQVGDSVATANGRGGYGEYAIAPAAKTIAVPDHISLEIAAALMLQGITAHYLACSTYPIQAGNTVLIHAAAGGVGQLLVQIAKIRGARVIATVSTEEKARIAKECGADEVILYSRDDFEQITRNLTDGKGVEVVYDGVGKATFTKGLNCLKPRGYMVLFGQASGVVEPVDPQVLNQKGSLFLTRPTIAHYTLSREEVTWRTSDLFHWIDAKQLKVKIDRTFPLKDVAEAQTYMENRLTKGKVLLLP